MDMNRNDIDRREFLKTSGGLAAAATAGTASFGFSVSVWASELKVLGEHESRTLLKMSRQIYPHPTLGDAYYAVVVSDLDAEASGDQSTAELLAQGVKDLDGALGLEWLTLSDGNKLAVLKSMESSPFFQKVRGKMVVSLYNNPLVWRHLGYEGPSAHLGGYLHRGFDDLHWLEQPPESASPKAG